MKQYMSYINLSEHKYHYQCTYLCYQQPGRINQTENPRRWGRAGESERESEYGNTTMVLPYVCHQMLSFI